MKCLGTRLARQLPGPGPGNEAKAARGLGTRLMQTTLIVSHQGLHVGRLSGQMLMAMIMKYIVMPVISRAHRAAEGGAMRPW